MRGGHEEKKKAKNDIGKAVAVGSAGLVVCKTRGSWETRITSSLVHTSEAGISLGFKD